MQSAFRVPFLTALDVAAYLFTSHLSPIAAFVALPAFRALSAPLLDPFVGELKSPEQLSGQRYFCDNKPTRQEKQKPRIQFRSSSQIGPNCRVNEYAIGDELDCAQQIYPRSDQVQGTVSPDRRHPVVTIGDLHQFVRLPLHQSNRYHCSDSDQNRNSSANHNEDPLRSFPIEVEPRRKMGVHAVG